MNCRRSYFRRPFARHEIDNLYLGEIAPAREVELDEKQQRVERKKGLLCAYYLELQRGDQEKH
jgi:hypothetical protein